MEEFSTIGLDAVVGSVGNGSTLRLISDIEGVRYTEGRFLPYFFPDTFHEGGDPVKEAKENWITARRAILRKPIDRIGYGGYLKLTLDFPEFLDYVENMCNEFRELYTNAKGITPYCVKKVAVLNSWGKIRSWGCHMVHHALYQKQNYSYAGIIEVLSGAPFDVHFISFDDILAEPEILKDLDVVINVGDGDTAHTGGSIWENAAVSSAIREFVYNGGGFIGKLNMRTELNLMSHLDVMLSMDSANMHLASLVNIPVVSVWGATHPYAGFMGWKQLPVNTVQLDLSCRPCSVYGQKPCWRGDYACLRDITPEQVIAKIEGIID